MGADILVNMTANDHELLRQFTQEQSQDAFTALVNRHLNLVYSAALRQVRSPQLAEEVSQSVFTKLACNAARLNTNTVLTAWLYQVTRCTAIDLIRSEARRQAREQTAFQMRDTNDISADWTRIEPLLDEAMERLDETDQTAILLRYFENKSLREVGRVLGTSEDAAQKRVGRAVERLRSYLSERKIAVGASGLVVLVSTHAIQAAPSGLAGAVANGAVLASTSLSTSTAVSLTKAIAMTTLQKTIITAVVVATAGVALYQTGQVSDLRGQVRALEQQRAALSNQMRDMQRQRDDATNALAALSSENAALKKNPSDVLKLRGQVGRLQQENTQMGSSSPLSRVTASPEARKMMRDQQKLGMAILYGNFEKQLNLSSDQKEKLNNLLADHVMQNVDDITIALRDHLTPDQFNSRLATEDSSLGEKLSELLGKDGAAQYHDYSKELLSTVTTDQFKAMLTGTAAEKEEKAGRFRQVLQDEVRKALAEAGLPADYQALPILNFRNIAFEQEADRSIRLLEDIYQRAAVNSDSFLSADDLAKFQEFKNKAVQNTRGVLNMNRILMAPISQ